MAKYLSKAERGTLSIMYGTLDFLKELEAMYVSLKRPKTTIKWIRASMTFIKKAAGEMVIDVDDDNLIKLYKHAQNMQLVLRTKEATVRELGRLKEAESHVSIENDRFLTLCSFGYTSCKTCLQTDFKGFLLRDLFLEYDIEPIKEDTEDCCFRHTDIKENAYMNLEECVATKQLFRVQPGLVLKGFTRVSTAPLNKCDWHYPMISTSKET